MNNTNNTFLIESVSFNHSDASFTLTDVQGRSLSFVLEGDCCSHSFFDADTKLDVSDLSGHKLLKVETVTVGQEQHGEVEIYMTKLITDRASISLAWRNESNGYYSGYLTVEGDAKSYGVQIEG